ncbi:MAG: iron exporter MbfA [Chthoniobacterales bacterium]
MKRAFSDLNESEVLALAAALEEEDSRVYGQFARHLDATHPATAATFRRMQQEEESHQARLTALHRERFGEHLPLIRRQDVRGFISRRPIWLKAFLPIEHIRREAESMEIENRRFYEKSAARAKDPAVRDLLLTLAAEEAKHEDLATRLEKDLGKSDARREEDAAQRRQFILQIVQPGLVGLMDGSVSTLAPVFAAAFATKDSWDTFLVGLAASIGAGISMGFAEALSDDGALSGRGRPYLRGTVCGLMTTLGGIGHTVPFLVPNFHLAMLIAIVVVVIELITIAWIKHRYMDSPLLPTIVQVVFGGVLVFIAGVLIGNA